MDDERRLLQVSESCDAPGRLRCATCEPQVWQQNSRSLTLYDYSTAKDDEEGGLKGAIEEERTQSLAQAVLPCRCASHERSRASTIHVGVRYDGCADKHTSAS